MAATLVGLVAVVVFVVTVVFARDFLDPSRSAAGVTAMIGAPGAVFAVLVGRLGIGSGTHWTVAPLRSRLLSWTFSVASLFVAGLVQVLRTVGPGTSTDDWEVLSVRLTSVVAALGVGILTGASGMMIRRDWRTLYGARQAKRWG